ncbi:MAG: head GIN domain-containing protein [Bacteroidales bacterium]
MENIKTIRIGSLIGAFFILFSVATTTAQDVSKEIPVEGFTKVYINIACEVDLIQAEETKLVIEAEERLLEEIDVEVSNGILRITSDRKGWKKRKDEVDISLTVKNIESFQVAAAVNLYANKKIYADKLSILVGGVANINMELECNKLMADISGVADIDIRGKASLAVWKVSGTATLDAEDFITEATRVDFSGVGKGEVHATKILKASVSGLGLIEYSGNPASITTNVSGLGKIKQD